MVLWVRVQHGSPWAKIMVLARQAAFFSGGSRGESVFLPFHLLETAYSSRLVTLFLHPQITGDRGSLSHAAIFLGLTSQETFSTLKEPCDNFRPTGLIQDSLPISRSAD